MEGYNGSGIMNPHTQFWVFIHYSLPNILGIDFLRAYLRKPRLPGPRIGCISLFVQKLIGHF